MLSFSLLMVAAVLFVFAGLVWRASSSRSINRRFTAFALSVAFWATGVGASHGGYYMDLSTRIAFAAAALATASFLGFIAAYSPQEKWPSPTFLRFVYGASIVFALLALTTDLIAFGPYLSRDGIRRQSGPLYWLFAGFISLTWISAFTLFIARWRIARGRARAQLKYLGAGMLLPGSGVLITNLLLPLATGRSTYGWIGPWFGLIFVTIVGHAIIRRRLTDLHLVVHRGLTFATAIFLSALPVALLLALSWPHLLRELDSFELGILLFGVGLVTVLIPITRDASNRLLDRYVYRTHANYQRTLREASQVLTRVLDLEALLAFISSAVVRSTAAEGVAVYLREGHTFKCAVVKRAPQEDGFEAPSEAPAEVVRLVDVSREPVLAEELARDPEVATAPLYARLSALHWPLVLPVVSEDHLIAVIAVGPKLSGDAFYNQDIDLLMTLANQASVAIKNAQFYTAVVVANKYLESIAATIESGVIAINSTGQIAMLNRAAEHLTGLTLDKTSINDVGMLPSCLSEPLLATVADGLQRTQPEIDLPTATPIADAPVSRPVICTTSAVKDAAGAVHGAVAVFSDLTPLKELEVKRRRAEQLAYFEALAAGIAHEIKNPLVAIKTFAQLLPRRRNDARFLDEFGSVSTREIDRMQRLVDRLHTLSRPPRASRDPVDLRVPLGEALELLQPTLEEKRLTTNVLMEDMPYVVLGNHAELEQLFLNLILNAHDATPNGGSVTVELTRTETQVIAAVSDTGPGIAPELLGRLFEPFFSTKARGSGLGLAVSAGIVQAHGARLLAANNASGGAVFTVEFPIAPSRAVSP